MSISAIWWTSVTLFSKRSDSALVTLGKEVLPNVSVFYVCTRLTTIGPPPFVICAFFGVLFLISLWLKCGASPTSTCVQTRGPQLFRVLFREAMEP